MSTPTTTTAQTGVTPQEFTTAQLNGHPVAVRQTHRRWTAADYPPGTAEGEEYEPVAVTVVAPVRLSLDDVAAALFGWLWDDGGTAEELADDAMVRSLIAETVINDGSGQLEELRCSVGAQTLDAEQAAYLAYCRERAAAVFTPRPERRSPYRPATTR